MRCESTRSIPITRRGATNAAPTPAAMDPADDYDQGNVSRAERELSTKLDGINAEIRSR
jgi:hypothetical protein